MATEDSEDKVGKNNASEESPDTFDVIIIGAGAAGVGAAIALAVSYTHLTLPTTPYV